MLGGLAGLGSLVQRSGAMSAPLGQATMPPSIEKCASTWGPSSPKHRTAEPIRKIDGALNPIIQHEPSPELPAVLHVDNCGKNVHAPDLLTVLSSLSLTEPVT